MAKFLIGSGYALDVSGILPIVIEAPSERVGIVIFSNSSDPTLAEIDSPEKFNAMFIFPDTSDCVSNRVSAISS